jgi:cyclic lactone autoinducer peptide
MKKKVALLLVALGLVASTAASTATMWFLFDEPEAPNSLIG